MKNILRVGYVGLLCLGMVACGKSEKPAAAKNPAGAATEVDVVVMRPRLLEKSAEVNGSVLAQEYAELRAEVAGRLVYLNVREGTKVGAGTVVARLFNDDLKAQLARHKAQLTLATTTRDRLEKLLALDGVNRQDYDQAVAQVAAVEADIAYVDAQLRKTEVTTPFAGTLGLRNVSSGAYVTPADVIATIQQTDALKVDFNVPENLAGLVKVGNAVRISVEGVRDTLKGNIVAVEPQLSQQTRNLKVRAFIDNAGAVAPGGFAKVYLDAGSSDQALLLPTNAIVPDTRYKRVYVISGGKAKLTTVETGYRLEDDVEIVSGLKPGDTVAISGILYLRPDAPVKVRPLKP